MEIDLISMITSPALAPDAAQEIGPARPTMTPEILLALGP